MIVELIGKEQRRSSFGAGSGKWCWGPLQEALAERGAHSLAIDLPGHGEDRRNPWRVAWRDYVRRVCDAAAGMVPRPVLVGHSMGGGVITSAAEVAPGAFEQLIYLAAFVPANGDSILKLASKEAAPPELIKRPWRGDSLFHQADAERIFFHDCPRSAHWASLVQPQPVQPVLARIRTSHGASNRIPRSYIAASHDRAIPLPFQRRMAAEAGIDRIAEIETGHSPFLAQPGQLADLLISLVKG